MELTSSSNVRGAAASASRRHRGLLFLALLAFTYRRSEAFASGSGTQSHSLFGIRRGGASTFASTSVPASSTPTATAATARQLYDDKHRHHINGEPDPSASTSVLKATTQRLNGVHKVSSSNVPPTVHTSKTTTTSRFASTTATPPPSASSSFSSNVNGASAAASKSSLERQLRRAVEYVAETKLPTDIGQFQLRAYRVPGGPIGQEPCVIYARDHPPFGKGRVPVRIHDQCLTSEVFRSQR